MPLIAVSDKQCLHYLQDLAEMKAKQILQNFIFPLIISILFCLLTPLVSNSQNISASPSSSSSLFYMSSDFWGKVTLAILTTSLGALLGYLSSEKKRRDESIELSYTIDRLSVLEFKKDIGKKVSIRYGNSYEVADLYVMSCDVENTGKRVIKNEDIIFEISPANTGILECFFEPPLGDNPMGVEEVEMENSKAGEAKKKYKIRNILNGQKIGFRFITARLSEQDKKPNLFVSGDTDSKVQLVPKSLSKESDENSKIVKFITFFLLFLILPQIFTILPLGYGNIAAGLIRLVIFIVILPHIGSFSARIADILTSWKVQNYPTTSQTGSQSGRYNVIIGTASSLSIGDIYKKQESLEGESPEEEGSEKSI